MTAPAILSASGIYSIRNTVNGKVYVGSSVNIRQRWKTHKAHLRGDKHHSPTLQRSWNMHGESCFSFDVIEHVRDVEELLVREQYWLDTFRSFGCNGYNSRPIAASNKGFKPSPESIAKRLKTMAGWKHTEERKKAASERMKGKRLPPVSVAGKESQIAALRARVASIETRAKISAAKTGKFSEKQRQSLVLRGKLAKGKPWTQAQRDASERSTRSDDGLKIKSTYFLRIRESIDGGATYAEIAKIYGVTRQAIFYVVKVKMSKLNL